MAKINLNDIVSGFNLSKINDNFQKIATALNDKVLWRNSAEGEPNDMHNPLDMNGQRIYNLPKPIYDHEPARKGDLDLIAVSDKLLRVEDVNIPAFPPVEDRRNKLMAFDNNGMPHVDFPNSDSATGLRLDLSTPDGAGMVGYRSATVSDALDSALESSASADQSAGNVVVDLHYGVCRGVGYNGTGGERVTTATAPVFSGDTIPVTSALSFVENQLVVYLGVDGEYYTGVTKSLTATSITLQAPIRVPLDTGALVGIFYTDESHPTLMGYRSIVDYAIRQYGKKSEVVKTWDATEGLIPTAGATIDTFNTAAYTNPGSNTTPSVRLTTTTTGSGGYADFGVLPVGDYIARITATPNLVGTTANLVISVAEGGVAISYNDDNNGNTPLTRDLYFHKGSAGAVTVNLLSSTASQQFAVSHIEILRVTAHTDSLNSGVHVLLGDSWFAQPGMYERFVERLPLATFINKGVAGQTASAMWGRYYSDVQPYNPTHVWVMAGTNDVATGVSRADFYRSIGIISSRISEDGAQGIFFNTSVGSPTNTLFGDLLTPSREYVNHPEYLSHSLDSLVNDNIYKLSIHATVPASSTKVIAVLPGITTKPCVMKMGYVYSQDAVVTANLFMGYAQSLLGTPADGAAFAIDNTIKSNINVLKTETNNRFVLISVENTATTPLTLSGFLIFDWEPNPL